MTNVFGRSGLINTRGPKVGYCNICDEYGPLTEDHVPPKGTLGIPQVDLTHIVELLQVERPTKMKKRRHMQDGVKFRSLCSRCNSKLLGATYDPALIEFSNAVTTLLRSSVALPEVVSIRITPGLVARAVLGHLFAIGIERRERTPLLSAAANFFLDPNAALPEGIDIYYWVYPSKNQVQIRDAGLLSDFFKTPLIVFWCLKYFPLGFFVAWGINDRRRVALPNLRDCMLQSGKHPAEVLLPLRSIPHPNWPEAPTSSGLVLYGDGALGAVPHVKKKTVS